MTQNSFRKHLSMPGMLSEVRECFDSIPDPVVSRGITLSGCLMTGLGVFSLKMTSLLSFEEKIRSDESREPAENFMSLVTAHPRYAARSYCLIMSAAFPSSAIRMASIGLYPSSAIESR